MVQKRNVRLHSENPVPAQIGARTRNLRRDVQACLDCVSFRPFISSPFIYKLQK